MGHKRFLLMVFCLPLAACGTTGHRVAVEPGASWMRPWERPYTVDGVRYVPLLNADGFREEGLASWYGAEEHGRPTSSGEVFDMHQPTAAHKILPMGCVVRVTNKANRRSTTARINDRGPFVAGRIVDLSYRAARDLDILDSGVAPVLLEVVASASGTASPAVEADPGRVYTIQVAAFSDREKARQLSDRVRKELAWSVVREVETERGLIYRLHAGKFSSRQEAEAARSRVANSGYPDAFIISQ